jgi:hypothetical protein
MSTARSLACLALLVGVATGSPLRAQSRIYVAPSSPTAADAVEVTVGDICVGFSKGPQILQQTIRIDGLTFFCPLAPPTLDTQSFFLGTLPVGTYTVNVYVDNRLTGVKEFDVQPPPAEVLPDSSLFVFLHHFRFRVDASWHAPAVLAGGGTAYGRQLTDESGYFWFFDPADAELTVRVIDGRLVNGHFWVFIASTTNLGFDVTVTDTGDGHLACAPPGPANCESRTYHGSTGTNQNFLDVAAF